MVLNRQTLESVGKQPANNLVGFAGYGGPFVIDDACDNGDNHFVQGGALQRTAPPSPGRNEPAPRETRE